MRHFFKHTILPTTLLVFILGCGIMSKPKENKEPIHVPQKISIEIPKALKSDTTQTNQSNASQKTRWYKTKG